MTTDLPLRCRCGEVRGTALGISPSRCVHGICYCDDCQAYAQYLERSELLDERGGSDIVQITPAQLRITSGAARIRCVRLSERGMLRWFAGCCQTPIANTMPLARLPFVGMLASFIDGATDQATRERAIGKPVAYAFGRFARGGAPAHAPAGPPVRWMLHVVPLIGRGLLMGLHRPSPFFDAAGQPIVAAAVLTATQRDQLRPLG